MGVLAIFDRQGRWADTHVCDALIRDHLAPLGAAWGRTDDAPPVADDVDLHAAPDHGTQLVYLPTAAGFVGVLLEAGEWLAVPVALVPDSTAALPSHDAFIDNLLVLTGHAEENE